MEAAAGNGLAWLYVATHGRSPEQVREALTEAEQAVALAPDDGDIWNTLAWPATERASGTGAGTASERSMRSRGGAASDWVILAMTRRRQGQEREARDWLAKAVAWTRKDAGKDPDIERLLVSEATYLLGEPWSHGAASPSPPAGELPADPFAR